MKEWLGGYETNDRFVDGRVSIKMFPRDPFYPLLKSYFTSASLSNFEFTIENVRVRISRKIQDEHSIFFMDFMDCSEVPAVTQRLGLSSDQILIFPVVFSRNQNIFFARFTIDRLLEEMESSIENQKAFQQCLKGFDPDKTLSPISRDSSDRDPFLPKLIDVVRPILQRMFDLGKTSRTFSLLLGDPFNHSIDVKMEFKVDEVEEEEDDTIFIFMTFTYSSPDRERGLHPFEKVYRFSTDFSEVDSYPMDVFSFDESSLPAADHHFQMRIFEIIDALRKLINS